MSFKLIDQTLIAQIIATLSAPFGTRAVSEHPRLAQAHPDLRRERNWHAWVGRCISAYHGKGPIPALRKGEHRGGQQYWLFEASSAPVQPSGPVVRRSVDGLGPQSAGDKPFTAQMRRRQSEWRRDRLRVPCGTGPQPHSTAAYGNMLRPEDARRGLNFLTPEIFAVVEERLAQGRDRVEPFRLLHNLLSSQPMCFNLFAPLVRDRGLASALMAPVVGGPIQVTEVRIEYSPEPAAEYLNDRTSFDAFVAYRRPDGRRGFVGIETKLTEPFSPTRYDRPEYRRWMRPGGPWQDPSSPRLADVTHNQLWRDHLLAVALRDHGRSPFDEGRLILVRHPGDQDCTRAVAGYTTLLTAGTDTFADWPLDRLLAAWDHAAPGKTAWLADFRARYAVP